MVSNIVGTRVNTRPCYKFNVRFYLTLKTYFRRARKIWKFKIINAIVTVDNILLGITCVLELLEVGIHASTRDVENIKQYESIYSLSSCFDRLLGGKKRSVLTAENDTNVDVQNWLINLANPKSQSFTTPWEVSNIFSGFISLCMQLCRWQYATACNVCQIICLVNTSGQPYGCLSSSWSTVCSQYSNTKCSFRLRLNTSSRFTRFGCFNVWNV